MAEYKTEKIRRTYATLVRDGSSETNHEVAVLRNRPTPALIAKVVEVRIAGETRP
jgi:hypothetical protein